MYKEVFRQATGVDEPYPYQVRLATDGPARAHLLNVPTGLGKTAAAVLAWLWRRRFSSEEVRATTPRRLVFCLPMRVLAEQTHSEAVRWMDRLGLLAGEAVWELPANEGLPTRASRLRGYTPDPADPRELGWVKRHDVQGSGRIAVHLLMGGEDRTDWALWPERDAVMIGTQDMLLSRALNRGYASRRPRWPIEFGLLNNDCLWVFDEVQLLGPGLATGLQLEAFRSHGSDSKYFGAEKPCVSWYMSATASRRMLESREWREEGGDRRPPDFAFELSGIERSDTSGILGQRRLATKHLESRPDWSLNDEGAAVRTLARHREMVSALSAAPPDIPRRTLIICNTIDRARKLYAAVSEKLNADTAVLASPDLVLLHSRYRPVDRARQQERLKPEVSPHAGQIVFATQVVEAGVDLSSAILWTEIAPLPSIVQRLGRLNRAGEFGHNTECRFGWTSVAILAGVPLPALPQKSTKEELKKHERGTTNAYLPYDRSECEAARRTLAGLTDASPANLETQLRPHLKATLQPPNYSLQRHELLDFFDTDSNLSLGYTDVSPFVRGVDLETDIYVVWRDWDGELPPFNCDIGRQEICHVPIWHVIGKGGLSSWGLGFIWLGRERGWQPASRENLLPGATLLLPCCAGGYSDSLGWTGRIDDAPVASLYEEP